MSFAVVEGKSSLAGYFEESLHLLSVELFRHGLLSLVQLLSSECDLSDSRVSWSLLFLQRLDSFD